MRPGESYCHITAIWKSFSQRKNLSDVQSENKSGHVAALPGLHPDLVSSKTEYLKRLTARNRDRQSEKVCAEGGEHFPWSRCPPLPVFSRVSDTVQVTGIVNALGPLCCYRQRDITLLRPSLKSSAGCLRETLQCCHSDLHLWTCPGRSTVHWPDCTARTEDITWGFYQMEQWLVAGRTMTVTVRKEFFLSFFLMCDWLLHHRIMSKPKNIEKSLLAMTSYFLYM